MIRTRWVARLFPNKVGGTFIVSFIPARLPARLFPRSDSLPSGRFNQPNRRVRTRTHGDVGGEKPKGFPLSRFLRVGTNVSDFRSLRRPPFGGHAFFGQFLNKTLRLRRYCGNDGWHGSHGNRLRLLTFIFPREHPKYPGQWISLLRVHPSLWPERLRLSAAERPAIRGLHLRPAPCQSTRQ